MKAKCPFDGRWYYFVDKCLPFGSSISCAHFQAFSDAVAHIVSFRTKKETVNYLDDFFFAALIRLLCNQQVQAFLDVCAEINFPVSFDKTFWGTTTLVFLGLLIDTVRQLVCIPQEKIMKATQLIHETLSKKKITLHRLQKLCGYLNFLCRAIIPGRAFTRRLYAYTSGDKLKPHHHINMGEMKADLRVWLTFLGHSTAYCRPFIEYQGYMATEIDFYTNSSRNFELGMGGICQNSWMFAQWGPEVEQIEPSIEYLELYALAAGVLTWLHRFKNKRIFIFCDNMSVVHMINNMSSSCKNCMVLIRLITLESLYNNMRVYARHVKSEVNQAADALSRLNFPRFKKVTSHKPMDVNLTPLPQAIWPIEKIWIK